MTGKELKYLRMVYHLKQVEVAEIMQVERRRLALWEKNNAEVPCRPCERFQKWEDKQ